MSDKSGIAWTEATWNPIIGCTKVSPGCLNCYAERQAPRVPVYAKVLKQTKDGKRWNGKLALRSSILEQPIHWRRPRRIFVGSMSDIFHVDVPMLWLAKLMNTMMLSKQHVFQVLTKRPARMLKHIEDVVKSVGIDTFLYQWGHVQWGTTCEDQERANERVFFLWKIKKISPRIKTWVSAEPLIGPIDFMKARGKMSWPIDWIVAGGESGSMLRPMDAAWCRKIYTDCKQTHTAFFMKQMGGCPDARKKLFDLPMDLRIREYPQWR